MGKNKKIVPALAQELQLPREQFPGQSSVHITSCDSLEMRGCRGVLDCSDNHIALSMGEYILEITGFSLQIVNFTDCRMEIRGEILRLELVR